MSEEKDVFTVRACRCKRCGGLLTSEQGLRDGYGPCCLRKMQIEAANREMEKLQMNLFELEGKEKDDGTA